MNGEGERDKDACLGKKMHLDHHVYGEIESIKIKLLIFSQVKVCVCIMI